MIISAKHPMICAFFSPFLGQIGYNVPHRFKHTNVFPLLKKTQKPLQAMETCSVCYPTKLHIWIQSTLSLPGADFDKEPISNTLPHSLYNTSSALLFSSLLQLFKFLHLCPLLIGKICFHCVWVQETGLLLKILGEYLNWNNQQVGEI